MSAAESAPAVSRPEGGWRGGDAVFLVSGADAIVWQRTDGRWCRPNVPNVLRYQDAEIDAWLARGQVVYVHAPREPEPAWEPLPTELRPIRATVRGQEGVVLVKMERGIKDWYSLASIQGHWWHGPEHITAWERLKTHDEWEAEQDGDTVRVPREAVEPLRERIEWWRDDGMYCGLPSTIIDFLDAIDAIAAERGDQA